MRADLPPFPYMLNDDDVVLPYLCLLLILSSGNVSASAYFHICHKSDPDISICVKNTIEDMRPRLITGNKTRTA